MHHSKNLSTRALIMAGTAFAITFIGHSVSAQGTEVGGNVGNQSWTKDKSPYLVTNDVFVSGSLVIREGVEVRMVADAVFEVGGRIRAVGTEAEPVVFQPADTNVAWQGLLFAGSVPGSYLVHTTIQGSRNSGVRIFGTAPAFTNCVIRNNSSPSAGGGICTTNSDLSLFECIISGNTALGMGGGVHVESQALPLSVAFVGCVISNNSGMLQGGGIRASVGGGMLLVDRSTIVGNSLTNNTGDNAPPFGGGGIALIGDGRITHSRVASNSCHGTGSIRAVGGGIAADAHTLSIQTTVIDSNTARTEDYGWSLGGGVYIHAGTLQMLNCLVTRNRMNAGGEGSGVLTWHAGVAELLNCTLVGNEGNGCASAYGLLAVTNSIIYGNVGSTAQIGGYPANATVAYSCIQNGVWPGPGNITFNPSLFAENFTLLVGSPCIDGGHPGLEFRDGCVKDDSGYPCARGGDRNDMGAYGGPSACYWTDPSPEPKIRIQADAEVVLEGDSFEMGVIATGDSPLTYQWYRGDTVVPGATNTIIRWSAVELSDSSVGAANTNWYHVKVSNATGSVTSWPTGLMVSELAISASVRDGKAELTIRRNKPIARCAINSGDSPAGPWTTVATIDLSSPMATWQDPSPTTSSARFYWVAALH